MHNFNFTILILIHLISGLGILGWFKIKQNPFIHIPAAIIIGLFAQSWVPAVLDMMHIKLTPASVAKGLAVATVVFGAGLVSGWASLKQSFQTGRSNFQLYEIPALLVLAYMLYLSIWRCYFFPVTPRDMLSGPECLAKYALKEGTVFNSFFQQDLSTTNNHLKSPFMTGIQIIYKMYVQPFGQIWLSIVVVSFITIIYTWVKQSVHGVIAGLLAVLFVATPESFAYTFMALFDYSNMVLLALGAYYLRKYFTEKTTNYLWVSAIFMGLATYVRTETLVLVAFFGLLFLWHWRKNKVPFKQVLMQGGILMSFALLMYVLVMNVYIKGYLPVQYDVSQNINPNLADVSLFFTRFSDMNSQLIFGDYAKMLWNYFMYFFIALLILELVIYRKVSAEAGFWLFAVLVVYIGLPFIGYLLPLADIMNTTKRGLFKILPFMLLYMSHNQLLIALSNKLWNWERDTPIVANAKVAPTPKPIPVTTQKKHKGK